MNELVFIVGGMTGGAVGIWFACYYFTREVIQDAVRAKVERALGRREGGPR